MKILSLEVKGFRSLYDTTWEPGDLNIVIGPNASGKSNLLRILEMLSVSARGGLAKYIQREGGMEPILWDGASDAVQIRLRTSPLGATMAVQRQSLTYQLELARLGKTSTYRVGQELLANFYLADRGERDEPFKLLERSAQRAVVFDEHERMLAAPEAAVAEEETLLSMAAGPFTANHRIAQYQREMVLWSVYHDLHTNRDAVIRQPAVATAEKRVAPDGQNLVSVLHTLYQGDREFKREVNTAMRAAFGDEFEELIFPPAADQRIQFRVRWKSLRREQPAADLSDGTLRFLFLLAVLANPDPPPLIAIDEPETGLHPSMLPIIAEYSCDAATRTQVILTTHSPAFLDAFKDTTPQPTITAVDWLNGKTDLRVRSGEELEHWLKQYTLGELYRSGELEAME
jgi:predicted ATPase